MTEGELHQRRTRKAVRRKQRLKARTKLERKEPILRLQREEKRLEAIESGVNNLQMLYNRAEELHEQRPEIQRLRTQD